MKITQTTTVNTKDLNGIDYLNGSSTVNSKDNLPVTKDGQTLKGALAKNNGYANINFENERIWIQNQLETAIEFQMEQIEYEDVPNGLSKYRIESKILNGGIAIIYKFVDEYFILNCTILDYNIYGEPTKVKVIEPKSKSLNGKELTIGKDCIIIRNNIHSKPTKTKILRLLIAAEKTLYQIEKNVLTSAPKGIINTKNGTFAGFSDDDAKHNMELIANGEDTFYIYIPNGIENSDPAKDNKEPFYIPIDLKDRTPELIQNYSFFKEEIKEKIGANVNILNGKKERLITGEVDSQQDFSNYSLDHRINIRNTDLEKGKELWTDFNTKVIHKVSEREDTTEPDEEDNNE